jgi:hypothetical protein
MIEKFRKENGYFSDQQQIQKVSIWNTLYEHFSLIGKTTERLSEVKGLSPVLIS